MATTDRSYVLDKLYAIEKVHKNQVALNQELTKGLYCQHNQNFLDNQEVVSRTGTVLFPYKNRPLAPSTIYPVNKNGNNLCVNT